MALKVHLLLNKTYFLPGEVVQVSVQVGNDTASSNQPLTVANIRELSFQASGTERTDPSYIQRLHKPENPVEGTDARKNMRTIFATETAVLISNKALAPRSVQHFHLRFRLPAILPPSFRGSSMRFLYMIEVKAVYELAQGGGDAVVYETTASTALMVWPSPGSTQIERRVSMAEPPTPLSTSGGGAPPPAAPYTGSANSFSHAPGNLSRTSSNMTGTSSPHAMSAAQPGQGFGQPPSSSSAPAAGGNDEAELGVIDYHLGTNNCKLKWREVPNDDVLVGHGDQGPPSYMPSPSLLSPTQSAGALSASMQHLDILKDGRGGAFSDDDMFDMPRMSGDAGERACGSGTPGSHIQRSMSGGGAFSRTLSRKASMFGKSYALNLGEQPLVRILLQAPLETPMQPGATFGGVLDFRVLPGSGQRQAQCHHVLVMLESEEVVAPEYRAAGQARRGAAAAGTPFVIRKVHAEHHEMTTDVAMTNFVFSVPATATPSFRTPMLSLRWMLRFELTVGQLVNFAALDKKARAPRMQMEQLIWALPLTVRPPVVLNR